jgi:hypothetical protein
MIATSFFGTELGGFFVVVYLIFWLLALIDCITRELFSLWPVFGSPDRTKIFWLIFVGITLFFRCLGPVGVIIYWVMNGPKEQSYL